ncbi:TerC family protein [Nisaea acidiphila]|uniref:TerC family protein n=1 Tax=Nisaea acidiphila TaxID=1862145 RepID=A0A9J7ATI7_9PROT|nr:TerC family protein [Nisaea acidiphila]UUX49644.1 TerC family protein [Nisaea acidiphila]
MDWILDPTLWASLATLTALEIILGIDNIIFVSIVAESLPEERRPLARRVGLGLALILRLIMLSALAWIVGLTAPITEIWGYTLSWRDLILLIGGLFLLYKGTHEIHNSVEGDHGGTRAKVGATFAAVIGQIIVLDLVFSIDSVITAVGMVQDLGVMIAAVVIAMAVMIAAAGPIAGFIEKHPTTKMLALSFLMLVGVALIADGMHFHIPRGYIYFAVFFSASVEVLNLLAKRKRAAAG